MRSDPPSPVSAPGRVRRAGLLLAMALVSAAPIPVAQAKEVDGIVRWFFTRTDERDLTSDGYGGTLDLRWNRRVSPSLSYLLSVRYATSSQEPLFSVEPFETTTNTQLEPRVEIRLMPKAFELSVGHRWLQFRDRTDSTGTARRDESNLFGRFRTTFEKRPELRLEFDRRDVSTNSGPDTVNSRFLGQLSHRWKGLSASVGRRHTVADTKNSLKRTVDEDLLSATFNRSIAEGRFSIFANYNLNDLTGRDRLARETLVAIPRPVLQGLSALDPTPSDEALDPEPALVDGNRSGATNANIGGGLAGGSTGWNLGVELALTDPVNVIDVWLADPIPAENSVRYQWEVYRSDDNQVWTLVTAAAGRSYDPFDGRFRLTFSPVTARFVKIVNVTVDDALGSVFVSEIEVFGEELRRGTTETATRTENVAATFTWAPRESFTASASGFRNSIRNDREGQGTQSEDTTGNLTLSFRPSKLLLGNVSALTSRRSRTLQATESEQTYSYTLTTFPVKDLDLTVVGTQRDRKRSGETARTRSYLLRVATLLYRDLSFSADYGEAVEENLDTPRRLRDTLRATLDTRPREELELNSSLLSERLVTPSMPVGERVQKLVNWRNRLTIRPSGVLNLTFQATYYRLPMDDGWSRVVQADWLPFPGGALQFSLDFREDIPLNGQDRSVRSARLRWNLNRKTYLDLDAARQITQNPGGRREARTLLTVFFQARF